MHRIVDSYNEMDKQELMRVLNDLRSCVQLEVFYPITKAINESKKHNKIDTGDYFKVEKLLFL